LRRIIRIHIRKTYHHICRQALSWACLVRGHALHVQNGSQTCLLGGEFSIVMSKVYSRSPKKEQVTVSQWFVWFHLSFSAGLH
jgi:hypothetical protein